MLVKPPLEELLPHVENRYTLAIAVAKRTRQLVSGAQPMARSESPNLVTLACEELAAGQIVSVSERVDPVVPLRPEVEAERLAAQRAKEEAERGFSLNDADAEMSRQAQFLQNLLQMDEADGELEESPSETDFLETADSVEAVAQEQEQED